MFSAINPRKRVRPHMSESGAASTTSLPATLAPRPREASTASSQPQPSDSTAYLETSSSQPKSDNSDGPPKAAEKEGGPKAPNPAVAAAKQPRKTRSWYGSLGQKSVPSTQIARETIMGDTAKGGRLPDFSRYRAKKSTDTLTDSDTRSVRTLPKPTDAAPPSEDDSNGPKVPNDTGKAPDRGGKDDPPVSATEHAPEQNTDNKPDEQPGPPPEPSQPASASSGWLGWLGGMYYGPAPEEQAKPGDAKTTKDPQEAESTQPEVSEAPASNVAQPQSPSSAQPRPQSNSWFGLWYGAPATAVGPSNTEAAASSGEPAAGQGEDVTMADAPPATAPQPPQPSAGSTWAFWSRDSGSKSTGKTPAPGEQGELAVMGEGSESSPKSSVGVPVEDSAAPPTEPPLKKVMRDVPGKPAKKNRRTQPGPMDLDSGPVLERPGTPGSVKTATVKPETPTSAKSMGQNLLLPDFKNTYRMQQNPSIVKQIARLLLRTRQPPANHVYLVKDPPKVKKAIAIGVHGLFPAAFLRPMIGQPTGTSMRFANHGAEAIRRWTEAHGCGDCEIEKIALEGEGKIADRVDNLWKLLLNWIDHIRRADLILVACHSQGVPVGIMLVAKLIDLGIITTARIGICAMAGVSLGPFPDYKSGMGMLMGSAAELWQFSDPESEISKRLEHSLQVALDYGTRVTYVGSIDDQLVPMESAVYSPASHPYIYRAVFIDGRIHAPDFIAHLVGFALKLRNLGISDQGLVRELSVALAGSLYSGEGHSRLYDDEGIYDLAVSHALETTVLNSVPCRVEKHEGLASANPYVLPWIMRGLLEEEVVKTELSAETAELLRQFDDWKPVTKALKDIKFRLEAVRSKL